MLQPSCTACAAQANEDELAVSWVGDSRAVLACRSAGRRTLACWTLTSDHNASNPTEAKRVRAAGGTVGRSEQEATAGRARRFQGSKRVRKSQL